MAIHLTPTELAREAGMERREVIEKCMELGVPIFQGRIDKTLFLANVSEQSAVPSRHSQVARPDCRSVPEGGAGSRIAPPSRRRRSHGTSIATRGADTTGSRTIADMFGLAAEKFGDRPAARFKERRRWADTVVSARRARSSPSSARGLIDLGLAAGRARGDAVLHARRMGAGRLRDQSAGGVVVPIYPTNSPEECAWVAGNSEARLIVCEDAAQVAKIAQAVRERCRRSRRSSSSSPARGHAVRRGAARARPRA